ncbi:ATP-binding protein [Nocardioides litoris]|uniref:ATP-binding protein n=1 Tax=Nocardioides litoris TaxID=1926648 RepID=UPI0014777D59|nr:ATP-binding protein [Nocardioides litoris]
MSEQVDRRRRTTSVPCSIDAVAPVRSEMVEHLTAAGLGQRHVTDAVAVMSELVMNALVHGSPDADDCVRLTWDVQPDGAVRIEVRDEGQSAGVDAPGARVAVQAPSAHDQGGRGMRLVEAFSREWSVDTSDGTLVTALVAPRP